MGCYMIVKSHIANSNGVVDHEFALWDGKPLWEFGTWHNTTMFGKVLGMPYGSGTYKLVGNPDVMISAWLLDKSAYWTDIIIFETIIDLDVLARLALNIFNLQEKIKKVCDEASSRPVSMATVMPGANECLPVSIKYKNLMEGFYKMFSFIKGKRPDDPYLAMIEEWEQQISELEQETAA